MPRKSKETVKVPGIDFVPQLFVGANGLDKRVIKAIEDASGSQRDILLDVCAWIARVQQNKKAWDALGRNIPEGLTPEDDNSQASKRKVVDVAEASRKKHKPGPMPTEDIEFEKQYYQGRDTLHPDLDGLGCGFCKLGTDELKFLSPFKGDMRLEVQNCIRICEDRDLDDPIGGPRFLMPFPHIEAIFIRPNPEKSAPRDEAVQFIIIPTAMTGASSIQRNLPLPIIFNVPDTKPSDHVLEYGQGDSYASVIQKILTSELEPFSVPIKQLSPNTKAKGKNKSAVKFFDASLAPKSSPVNEDVKARKKYAKGQIHLTDIGILFLPLDATKIVFLPFSSIDKVIVSVIKDLAWGKKYSTKKGSQTSKPKEKGSESREIQLVIDATEPWYDATDVAAKGTDNGDEDKENSKGKGGNNKTPKTSRKKNAAATKGDSKSNSKDEKNKSSTESKKTHIIAFTQIHLDLLPTLQNYLKKHQDEHSLNYSLCQMTYYDYDAGSLMTGFEPLDEDP